MTILDTIRRFLRRQKPPERATTPQPEPPVVRIELEFPWDRGSDVREALFDRWMAENGLSDSVTVPPAPATQRYTHKKLELTVDGVPVRADVMARNPAYDPIAEARSAAEAEEARRRAIAAPYSPAMEIFTLWDSAILAAPDGTARRGREAPVRDENGRQIGLLGDGLSGPTLRMAVDVRVTRVVDPPLPQFMLLQFMRSHAAEFGHIQIPIARAKDLRDELARMIVEADRDIGLTQVVIA